MAKNKKQSKSKVEISYPIFENDGSIINCFKFGEWGKKKYEIKLRIFPNGNIEELGSNLLHVEKDNNNFNILKIVNISKKLLRKSEYIIKRKDIFLIENLKPEFSLKSIFGNYSFNDFDYKIIHIDGNNANDNIDNLAIINRWNDKIINPPFRKLNYNKN